MRNKTLTIILSMVALFLSLPSIAADADDIGNWSAKFAVGPNHKYIATHCPGQVCLDMMCGGKGVFLGANTKFNGLHISPNCDLDLKTKMSKDEFVAALQCAGLDPVEIAA